MGYPEMYLFQFDIDWKFHLIGAYNCFHKDIVILKHFRSKYKYLTMILTNN